MAATCLMLTPGGYAGRGASSPTAVKIVSGTRAAVVASLLVGGVCRPGSSTIRLGERRARPGRRQVSSGSSSATVLTWRP